MSDLVKLDEAALKTKLAEIEQKVDALASSIKPMPDDIKQKLKDVLTWLIQNL